MLKTFVPLDRRTLEMSTVSMCIHTLDDNKKMFQNRTRFQYVHVCEYYPQECVADGQPKGRSLTLNNQSLNEMFYKEAQNHETKCQRMPALKRNLMKYLMIRTSCSCGFRSSYLQWFCERPEARLTR